MSKEIDSSVYLFLFFKKCVSLHCNFNLIDMEITVQFKEKYMDKPVTRTCVNMTKEQVINVYGLNEPDIEWYKFL